MEKQERQRLESFGRECTKVTVLGGNYRPTAASRSVALTWGGCLFVLRFSRATLGMEFQTTRILSGKSGSSVGSSDSEGWRHSQSDKSALREVGLRVWMRKDGSEHGSNRRVFLLFWPLRLACMCCFVTSFLRFPHNCCRQAELNQQPS